MAVGTLAVVMSGAGVGTAVASSAKPVGTTAGAARIALAFSKTLFDGKYVAAGTYYIPTDRPLATAVAKILGPHSVRSFNLRVGSSKRTGPTTFTVVLLGTLCTSTSKAPLPANLKPTSGHCVTNTSAIVAPAEFVVYVEVVAGHYYVYVRKTS